jgi:hypothetical protein
MNNTPRKPSTIYMISPDVDHETLLVQTCENLASASVMASNVAALVGHPSKYRAGAAAGHHAGGAGGESNAG